MDLIRAIRELREEQIRIDKTIARLERLIALGQAPGAKVARARPSRRGRKSMGEEERRRVSERMARYWAERRATKEGSDSRSEAVGQTSQPTESA